MSRPYRTAVALLLIATTFTGCHPTQPFYFHEDGDLSHYLDKATQIETPDVDTATLADAQQSKAPLTVSNPDFDKMWDLTLEECISISLQNSKTIRNLGGVTPFGFADALVGRSSNFSVYDPALQETSAGSRPLARDSGGNIQQSLASGMGIATAAQVGGVEAALAEFDANLSMAAGGGGGTGSNFGLYSRSDVPQNATNSTFFPNVTDTTDSGWTTTLAKKTATGAAFSLKNTTSYDHWNNRSTMPTQRALQSFWTTAVEAQWDQPLLRGRGAQINRIPIVLARINTDIQLSAFEGAVRNLVMDLETTYWDLHLAYRTLETAKIGRNSAQVTWKIAYEKWNQGVEPVQAEAQAREQYFFFRAAVEESLRNLYNKENQLRFLMGLAATDGRLIRPIDEPTMAKVTFDWGAISAESLVRAPELRQQKWAIKQRELELVSAKNLLLPVLDVGARYRWIGAGNDLINNQPSGQGFAEGASAVETLTNGDFQDFAILFNFQMPVGFRRELAAVRHAQLQLARDKAKLEDMELNVSHLLTTAIRSLDGSFVVAETQFNRWSAAEKEVESNQALYKGGKTTLDLVLDSQKRRAQAQADFYKAVTDYSKAIADVHFRKGSLLEYNNVALAEGPWMQKAYWDAKERARERDASYYLDYGWTRPSVVSRGPVPQGVTGSLSSDPMPGEIIGEPTPADAVPVPEPTPADDAASFEGPALSPPNAPAPGRVTQSPSGPVPNTLPLSAAATAIGRAATHQQAAGRFDWDSLETGSSSTPASVPSAVVPAGFSSQLSDK